jgi:hypothetical protein
MNLILRKVKRQTLKIQAIHVYACNVYFMADLAVFNSIFVSRD